MEKKVTLLCEWPDAYGIMHRAIRIETQELRSYVVENKCTDALGVDYWNNTAVDPTRHAALYERLYRYERG
jgi:hypothetical protein